MSRGEWPRSRQTKYQPLIGHLALLKERDVTLTFVEIEAIIGVPLSVSAMTISTPWHATTKPQVRQWEKMGWLRLL